MIEKIKETAGRLVYIGGGEKKFNSLAELIDLVKEEKSGLPEFVYVYGVYPDENVYQIIFDFNSAGVRRINIEEIRFKRFQKYLGDILLEKNLITKEELQKALEIQNKSQINERLGEVLVRLGYVKHEQILKALEEQVGHATLGEMGQ